MTDRSDTGGGSEDGTASQGPEITEEIGEDEQPSEAVVRATAAFTNKTVLDLDPLFHVVDPDHLDGLFEDRGKGPGRVDGSVTFTFNGCQVSVTAQKIVVQAADESAD